MEELIIEGFVSVIFQHCLDNLPCLTGNEQLLFGAAVLDKFNEKGGIHESLLRTIRRAIFNTASCDECYRFWVKNGNWIPLEIDFPPCAQKVLDNISKFIEDNRLSAACTSA